MTVYEEPELQPVVQAESIETLLERYEKPLSDGWLVKFHELPEGVTAYNASKVFEVGEIPHMLVREEGKRADQEFTSKLAIYRCSDDGRDCYPTAISNLLELTEGKIAQDPAVSYVNDRWAITWVEVEPNVPGDPTQGSTFKSVTAVGSTLDKLERLVETVESDEGTKEVRNIELPETKGLRYARLLDGRIGVTTRTSINGEYKMCYAVADSWDDITTEFLASAKEIKGLEGLIVNDNDEKSPNRRWIGPNDQQLLATGEVSLLFHAGRYVENGVRGNRVYDDLHCVLTPGLGDEPAQAKYLKIIARAKDFNIPVEVLPPKRPDVEFVSYPSCLIIAPKSGDESILLASLRDAGEVGQQIPDPLEQWRADHPEFADNPFPQSAYEQAVAA